MNGFFYKIKTALRNFMAGRYGSDKLNIAMLLTALGLWLISMLIPVNAVRLVLTVLYYVLWGWSIFRMMSRNTYKRYQENRKFLQWTERFRDRQHRYYDCPRCRQQVRVPRGKGKIAITCPRCREKFVKKT